MVQFVIEEVNNRRQVRILVTASLEKEMQARVPTVFLLTQVMPITTLPLSNSFGPIEPNERRDFFFAKALFPCKRETSEAISLCWLSV